MYKTDFDFKMSKISLSACWLVKMMPEILKPMSLHAYDNFFRCLYTFIRCKIANEGQRSRTDGSHPT